MQDKSDGYWGDDDNLTRDGDTSESGEPITCRYVLSMTVPQIRRLPIHPRDQRRRRR